MHADWRIPQLVTQVDIDERSRLFLHAATHVFSSPLQRIGAEKAGAAESRATASDTVTSAATLRRNRASNESISFVMAMS